MIRYGKWAVIICLTFVACSEDNPSSSSPTEPNTQPDSPVASTLVLSQNQYNFASLGASTQLNATVTDQYGTYMPNAAITWTTSDSLSVLVNSRGLITAVSQGSAIITAETDGVKATAAIAVSQIATSINFVRELLRFQSLQDTIRIEPVVKDGRGNLISPLSTNWSSGDASIVSVDSLGLATSLGNGRTQITLSSDDISESLTVIVATDGLIVISTVSPLVFVEGSRGTLQGTGLWGLDSNELTIGGKVVQVTSGTDSQIDFMLPIFNCLPPRKTRLTLKTPRDSVATEVSVTPLNLQSLTLGQSIISTEACLHLDKGNSNEKYLIGALSSSESAADLNQITLEISSGNDFSANLFAHQPFVSTSSLNHTFPIEVRPNYDEPTITRGGSVSVSNTIFEEHIQGELVIRANEKLLIEQIGIEQIRREAQYTSINANFQETANSGANIGDTVPFNMGLSCNSGDTLQVLAKVAYIGQETMWYEDVNNPLSESFTTSEYQIFDSQYTAKTLPVLNDYFGDYGDIDSNGKLAVLVTKEVNKRDRVLGFVWGGDLVPSSLCSGANEAEIFYGLAPDPEGTIENRVVTKSWLTELYDPLIAHETTHVIQITRQFYEDAESKSTWEMEGGATLSEQLVGYGIYGDGPGLNLGLSEYNAGFKWYRDWASDLTYYFGNSDSGKIPGAPEECSWIGKESQGNSGPCRNLRAVYGVPSIFMRMVLDLYGPNYPGGEKALSKALVGSTDSSGLTNYSRITGVPKEVLLTTFAMTLWGDGKISNNLTSWNIHDVMSRWVSAGRLQPYKSNTTNLTLPLAVRASSSSYLEWSPPALHFPSSIRIETSGSGSLNHMVLWIQRIE